MSLSSTTTMTPKRALLGFAAAVTAVIAMSFVAYSGHLPRGLSVHPIDKVVHLSMAATLAFFLDAALRRKGLWPGSAIPRAALIIVPIGIEEYLQRFSAMRSSSLGDFAADALGVAIGITLARALKK
jgi:VanZ family protein